MIIYVTYRNFFIMFKQKDLLHFKHSMLPLIIRLMRDQDFFHCVHFKKDKMVRKLGLFHLSGETVDRLLINCVRLTRSQALGQ